jgi:hypothetical protein
MYEVFAVITDELGTRVVPTGDGSDYRENAENLMMRRMVNHPSTEFFVDYVPSPDEFNAY